MTQDETVSHILDGADPQRLKAKGMPAPRRPSKTRAFFSAAAIAGASVFIGGMFVLGMLVLPIWIGAGNDYINPMDPGVSYVPEWACTIDVTSQVTQVQMNDRMVWCATQHMEYLSSLEEE